jgi:hypothetical protein
MTCFASLRLLYSLMGNWMNWLYCLINLARRMGSASSWASSCEDEKAQSRAFVSKHYSLMGNWMNWLYCLISGWGQPAPGRPPANAPVHKHVVR